MSSTDAATRSHSRRKVREAGAETQARAGRSRSRGKTYKLTAPWSPRGRRLAYRKACVVPSRTTSGGGGAASRLRKRDGRSAAPSRASCPATRALRPRETRGPRARRLVKRTPGGTGASETKRQVAGKRTESAPPV